MLDALDRAERRELSKAGAFVRRRARSSIRRRKRSAAPGKPPSSHTGGYKRSILFGYEKDRGTVVIGPSASFGGSEVPSLLELGGSAIRDGKRVRYRGNPHMLPALEKEAPKFPKLFRNSVRR